MTLSKKALFFVALSASSILSSVAADADQANIRKGEKVQQIRFIEDDAQNYMVSKIFELKHQKANDIVPFIIGATKRYAKNSSVDRISYKAAGRQLVSVSCPVPLMPYVTDLIAKLDRPSPISGTGITRSVFVPTYRPGETMLNIMVKAGVASSSSQGAAQDATLAYDKMSNMIYWKDSINKNKDLTKYLTWLDRPIPQMNLSLNVYEVRESDLLDLGVDYLAWKNGPGLNLLDVGALFLDGSALASSFGPYGYMMFAPSFDMSFIRLLQQNGKAKIATSAKLNIVNSHNTSLSFTPDYQNITKNGDFVSAVEASNNDNFTLNVSNPLISISAKVDAKTGLIGYSREEVAKQVGALDFDYELIMKNVVERDIHGNELYDNSSTIGGVCINNKSEKLLNVFTQTKDVEQTIGVPFLSELPVLKYIFGTTTNTTEKYYYFVTANTEFITYDTDISQLSGSLISVNELINDNK